MPATSGSHSTTRQNKLLISDDGEKSGPAEEAKQINRNFNLNKSMQSNSMFNGSAELIFIVYRLILCVS